MLSDNPHTISWPMLIIILLLDALIMTKALFTYEKSTIVNPLNMETQITIDLSATNIVLLL